jgi:hypothetical protein
MGLAEVLAVVEPWGPSGDWTNVVSWDKCPPPVINVIVNREAGGYVMRRFVPSGDPQEPQRLEQAQRFSSRQEFFAHLRDPPLPSCTDVFVSLGSWDIILDLAPDGRLRAAQAAVFS